MKQGVVAQRCAQLTQEMLTVVEKHQHGLQGGQKESLDPLADPVHVTNIAAPADDSWVDGSLTTTLTKSLPSRDWSVGLAQLYDPSVVEEFAVSGAGKADGSLDIFAAFASGPSDERAMSGPSGGNL